VVVGSRADLLSKGSRPLIVRTLARDLGGLPGWLRLIVWLVLTGLWALASIRVLRPPADQDMPG
jgi:hypothetical protein